MSRLIDPEELTKEDIISWAEYIEGKSSEASAQEVSLSYIILRSWKDQIKHMDDE